MLAHPAPLAPMRGASWVVNARSRGQPVRTGYEQATLVVRTRQRDLGRRWGLPMVEAFPSVVTMGAPTRSDDHPQMRPS